MTQDELDAALERTGEAVASPDQAPGLITVEADVWCGQLSLLRATMPAPGAHSVTRAWTSSASGMSAKAAAAARNGRSQPGRGAAGPIRPWVKS